MRIAYFTNTYPRATDSFIRREVIGLRKRGFEVSTYSVHKSGSEHDVDSEVISEKGTTRFIFPLNLLILIFISAKLLLKRPKSFLFALWLAYKTARPGLKGHALQIAYFAEAIVLAEFLIQDKIEHLHNHLGDNSGTVTMLAAKLINVPYSISIHGPHIFFDGLHWALDKKTEYSKFVACIGHFCVSQMMLYVPKEFWHKFEIVRCGIDFNQFSFQEPVRRAKKLLYVGRLSSEKGISVLLESLALLEKESLDFELAVLGDGQDRAYLQTMVEDLGIADRITFCGFVDRETIVESLVESDIFILPSFAEGIPVVLMEAMASGVPVISTYVGGIAELVTDMRTGQLVSPSDVTGLAQAISRYINDVSFCQLVAKNARNKVENEFNIERQIDILSNLFLNP